MEYTTNEVIQYVKENDVKFIKLFFTDIFGATRSISIQPSLLERAFEQGISFDASAVPGFLNAAQSDLFLQPDPTTLSVLPWRPQRGRVARMFCSIKYLDGREFAGDTRQILKKVAASAQKEGLEIKVGTECEFYIFKLDQNGNPTLIPYDNAGYCSLAPFDKCENVRRDIILNLEQLGIEPETSHHETGPGQNEIDFKYSEICKAADNLATFKITVATIAAQDGLHSSFSPKPLKDQAGSGLHLNLSLNEKGVNITNLENKKTKSFIAGILRRIREITLFLNPLKESYDRLGYFEAPKYVSYSSQNRSQLIRLPAATGQQMRLELRSPDPSCNQYLAMAFVIAAGLDGIKDSLDLEPSVDINLFTAPAEKIKDLQSLPENLGEAIELASSSDFVKSLIPEEVLKAYIKHI